MCEKQGEQGARRCMRGKVEECKGGVQKKHRLERVHKGVQDS